MSYRSRPEPGRRGIPSGSANMTPLGGGYSQHSSFPERAAPPQPKKARVDTKPAKPSTTEADSMVEYAGKAAEAMFPDVSSYKHSHVSHAYVRSYYKVLKGGSGLDGFRTGTFSRKQLGCQK